jgi:hypothetical protein
MNRRAVLALLAAVLLALSLALTSTADEPHKHVTKPTVDGCCRGSGYGARVITPRPTRTPTSTPANHQP